MNTYYKVLGLEPGASKTEIKKAYFRLIRTYSPESDPEQFQKIREAYEQLKDLDSKPEGPAFPPLSEPWAEKMLQQIEKYRMAGDMEMFRDACEEAWRKFPKDIQFLYLLVTAQRKCGNTGKAVKSAEILVKKEPENKWFQRELAVSYIERGFTQKAYAACERAYELGCRDNDFILMYSVECGDFGEYNKAATLLMEIVRQEKKWTREDMPELVEAYSGLLIMAARGENTYFTEMMERLCRTLEQYRFFMEEYIRKFSIMLSQIGYNRDDPERQRWIEEAFTILKKLCREDWEKKFVKDAQEESAYRRIMEDSRVCDTLKDGYEAYFNDNPNVVKFALLDIQLCMIEERQEVLKEAEIIKQDYPVYYEKLKDFLRKLEAENNILSLKDGLLRTYNRILPDYNGGIYYEKYPQEKKKMQGTALTDGTSDEPYVRGSKKIGRNDPCPCGSGKKYKHCCMKKQA